MSLIIKESDYSIALRMLARKVALADQHPSGLNNRPKTL